MEFRLANYEDLDKILNIIKKAQNYMHGEGIPQWTNGYPNSDTIKEDINNGYSYVLEENQKIYVTGSVNFEGEETYDNIYEGEWLTHDKYAVIHRIAIDMDYKSSGMSTEFLKEVETLSKKKNIYSIKIDTHRKNKSMQKFLKKNGFKYCGIIYITDGSERFAYEKTLEK